jgi:hypothetical protein
MKLDGRISTRKADEVLQVQAGVLALVIGVFVSIEFVSHLIEKLLGISSAHVFMWMISGLLWTVGLVITVAFVAYVGVAIVKIVKETEK